MAREINSIWRITCFATLISLFVFFGISGVSGDETIPMDWPLLDSRYENHAWGDQFSHCIIWGSGLVTKSDFRDPPGIGLRTDKDIVIGKLDDAKITSINELIENAVDGQITDLESVAVDAGISFFNVWTTIEQSIPPTMGDFLLSQWGNKERVNTSDAASELVWILVAALRETDCPGAYFDKRQHSLLDQRSNTKTSFAMEDGRGDVRAPYGEYRVIALRKASDVESTSEADADLVDWIGREVSFGDQLQWVDGSSCNSWFVREADQFPLSLEDPNLSDLAIEPLFPPAHHVFAFATALDFYCDDDGLSRIGSLIRVDERVLVASSASGSTNIILEKPLTSAQVSKLQAQLKDMKFYSSEITGELDEATLTSVGFYAEYRGSKFRFFRTAITENLLDGLGVIEDDEEDDEALLRGYQPKRGADTLQEYSPDFAMQFDNYPEVTFDNLSTLLRDLNSLNLKAGKMPGEWVAGKLALGANQKEYTPSYSEIMAAALGDRIVAFIDTIGANVLARRWPENRGQFFSYKRFEIRHADVMGMGRFYYASAPITVGFEIPEVGK